MATRKLQVEIITDEYRPVKVVRKRKPRHGGLTLAVLTNLDGRGVERAWKYINEKGHTLA